MQVQLFAIFFLYSAVSVFALRKLTPKLCINCKHFITDNTDTRWGKCSLFPRLESSAPFLVNGVYNEEDYQLCSITRAFDSMCGTSAKYYKKAKTNHKTKPQPEH